MRKVRHEELTSQEWNRFFLRNAIGFSEEYASQECAKLTSQEYVCSQECKISFLGMRFLSSQEYASQEYEIFFQEYGKYFLKISLLKNLIDPSQSFTSAPARSSGRRQSASTRCFSASRRRRCCGACERRHHQSRQSQEEARPPGPERGCAAQA